MEPERAAGVSERQRQQADGAQEGDVDAALKTAAHIVEGIYSTQVQTHTSLETHGGIAEWEGDKLTMYISTQGDQRVARRASPTRSRSRGRTCASITEYMGGGFGSKLGADVQVVIAARLAKRGERAGQDHARSQARAPDHRQPSVGVREGEGGRRRAGQVRRAGMPRRGAPAAPARARASACPTGLRSAAGRRWGSPIAGRPRRRLHQRRSAARVPRARPSAGVLHHRDGDRRARRSAAAWIRSSCGCATCGPKRRTRSGGSTSRWARRRSAGASVIRRAMRRRARSSAGSAARPTSGPAAATARRARLCEIHPDGSVVNKIGTQDIGTGTRTLVAMITAETMGLPLDAVTAAIGDTDYPFAPGSGGSVTVGIGLADRARRRRKRAAGAVREGGAAARGRRRDQLEAKSGRIQVKATPAEGHDVEGCVQAARHDADSGARRVDAGPLGRRHERRAVRRRRGRHRDRRHARQQDRLGAGLRDDRRQADGREPDVRRHHHGPRLRALREPHPRSQHRARW